MYNGDLKFTLGSVKRAYLTLKDQRSDIWFPKTLRALPKCPILNSLYLNLSTHPPFSSACCLFPSFKRGHHSTLQTHWHMLKSSSQRKHRPNALQAIHSFRHATFLGKRPGFAWSKCFLSCISRLSFGRAGCFTNPDFFGSVPLGSFLRICSSTPLAKPLYSFHSKWESSIYWHSPSHCGVFWCNTMLLMNVPSICSL